MTTFITFARFPTDNRGCSGLAGSLDSWLFLVPRVKNGSSTSSGSSLLREVDKSGDSGHSGVPRWCTLPYYPVLYPALVHPPGYTSCSWVHLLLLGDLRDTLGTPLRHL